MTLSYDVGSYGFIRFIRIRTIAMAMAARLYLEFVHLLYTWMAMHVS